jgi:hypothetical protein
MGISVAEKKRKRKKPARDLTTEEVMRRLFPKEIRREAKKQIRLADRGESPPSKRKRT